MAVRVESGGGFSVLDGLALVTGAAVASVHVRSVVPREAGPIGWFWAWCLFAWLALTSAGPYFFLVRRFFTRPEGYPWLGDRLWAIAGLPWLAAAMVQTFGSTSKIASSHPDMAYAGCLTLGLGFFTIVSVPILAARFLWQAPDNPRIPEPRPWTHRVGIFLAVAWPIQCGVGLVLIG